MEIQRQTESFAYRVAEWKLAPWQSVAIDPDNPDLTQLAGLPDVQGRWAFPYQGVSHESMGGDKMHSWGVHPTDAPAVWQSPDDTVFYDPARTSVDVDPDPIYQEFKRIRPLLSTKSNRVVDLQEKIPGIIWRGMSNEEYEQAKQRGFFKSNDAANFTEIGQKDITCFSEDPDTAGSYASNYAPFQYLPTFTRPAHVVGVPDRNYPRNSVGEVEVPGQIPFSDITHHYRGDVLAIRPGRFGGYQEEPNPEYGYNGFQERPSRQNSPTIMMQWVADHPRKAKVGKMIRLSAYSERLLNKLQAEFNGWYQTHPHPITVDTTRGPIGHWPHVESFLADRYPEAYRGFSSGMEEAGVTLDPNLKGWGIPPLARSYETGPEAMADYGYDPAEVVAGMLLLHNRSHGFRNDLESADIQRLNDIAQKRHQMQQDADQKQLVTAATMNFDLAEDLAGEFDDWYEQNKEAQELELMPERGGPIGSWENIEKFFKDRYPAAYQGFTKAYEQAPLALDYNGYDTGPEAIAKHGYDPLEVAASMFYLHNQSDSARKELEKADEQRIIDVMRKRHEMSQGQNRSAATKLAKDLVLYRGLGLDFRKPGMEKIKAIVHPYWDAVPGESLVEAYDRSQKDEAEGVYDHPDLGPHLLDYISSQGGGQEGIEGYQLGSHWTTDISVAQDWSRHTGRTPVVLKARIPSNTKKHTFNPGWKYEKEWPMIAGTPVTVDEVHLWNPRDAVWHNVLQEPSQRYASMDPILMAQNMIRVAENNLIDDDEWEIIDKINDHLSNGRPASAVAVWMQNMIPIYHLSRAPEIIHAYERMHPTGTNRTSQQFAEAQASAFDIDTFNAEVAPVLSDLAMQRYTRRVNESYRDNPDFDEDADDDYHDPRITPSNPYGDNEDDDYDDDDDEQGEKEEETDLDGGHYDEVGVFHPEFEHFQKLIDTPSDSRKLKSPWSHRVVHYTTNRPIPQELRGKPKTWDYTGDLYGDFEFGGPAFWDLKDPNYGVYQINHPRDEMHKPPVGYLQYHQTIDADDNPTIHIDYLDTHPNYRLQGVATALMNALAQDYPNHRIDPGFTTEHGTGFTNFMRENAPGAQDRLNTETWSPSSPNVVSDDQMKEWGVKKKKSPVFASLNMIRQAERILAFYEQDFYIPTKKELEEAEHPKSWRQLLKELFHPEDEDY